MIRIYNLNALHTKGLLPCVLKLKLKRKLKRKLERKLKIKRTLLYLTILLTCVLKLKLNGCVSATNGSVSDFLRLCRPADTLYGSRLLVGGRGIGGLGGGMARWGLFGITLLGSLTHFDVKGGCVCL